MISEKDIETVILALCWKLK